MELPSERAVADAMPIIDPAAIHRAREIVREALGIRWHSKLVSVIDGCRLEGEYSPDSTSAGNPRPERNTCYYYGVAAGNKTMVLRVRDQFNTANNLTDRLAALNMIAGSSTPTKNDTIVSALKEWYSEPLLVNKSADDSGNRPVLCRARPPSSPASPNSPTAPFFSMANPNNVYALLVAFFMNNPAEFHRLDGEGYKFWVECVLKLDALNPQVASRVARSLEKLAPLHAAALEPHVPGAQASGTSGEALRERSRNR